MAIQSECSSCGAVLSVADEHAGRRARCPSCGSIYTVSRPDSHSGTPSPQAIAPTNPYGDPIAVSTGEMFWMRTQGGNEYGPVNREQLRLWFDEGRVGTGYQIRQGETGTWQDAERFSETKAPVVGTDASNKTSNPYSVQPQASFSGATPAGEITRQYPKKDRGVFVLVMGILSFAFSCGLFSIIAVVVGYIALGDIKSGLASPNDKSLVQIGFWLGVVNLVLHAGFLLFMLLMAAFSSF